MDRIEVPGPPGVRYRLFLFLYRAVLWLGEPLVWRYFRRRARGDAGYDAHLEERRGEGAAFEADLWVHAVSLGEMTSAEPLVRLALEAGHRVVTTHATPAGRGRAERVFADEIAAGQVAVRYAPIDRGVYWARFFAAYRPKAGLVMEMEFWPAMLEAARSASVPLVLANSQVPLRSLQRAGRQARFFGHPARRAAAVFAKSELMAERFRALGVTRIAVMGETRFDMLLPEPQLAAGRALHARLGRKVLCLASVVAGEEGIYLSALQALKEAGDPPFVIWVPRAPEVFDATFTMLQEAGFHVVQRSRGFSETLEPLAALEEADILLGDSMGEMAFYIAAADAVLVGGGFTPKGTHNIIEPLAQGKPVITGPDTRTIEFPAIEARTAGVLTQCNAPEGLVPAIRAALAGDSPEAEAFHAGHAGASARIFAAIRPLLAEDR